MQPPVSHVTPLELYSAGRLGIKLWGQPVEGHILRPYQATAYGPVYEERSTFTLCLINSWLAQPVCSAVSGTQWRIDTLYFDDLDDPRVFATLADSSETQEAITVLRQEATTVQQENCEPACIIPGGIGWASQWNGTGGAVLALRATYCSMALRHAFDEQQSLFSFLLKELKYQFRCWQS